MKSFAVIGVGTFGYFLCRSFASAGHEVMAIDTDEPSVERVRDIAAKAVIADASDRKALEALGLSEFEAVVVSLGEHIDASVLTTLYLKELGVKQIVVKAISADHGKVLERVGADEVVFPERDMAERVAYRMGNADVLEFIPLEGDYSLMEWAPDKEMVGKTLGELHLRRDYNVTVILVRQLVPEGVEVAPGGDFMVKDSDILVVLGQDEDLKKIRGL
ncbi:MAG: TrkA family potassium uptake protein [bacterium]